MTEKIPRQKWLISNVWEHFGVPEHWMPIWCGAHLAFETVRLHHHIKRMKILNNLVLEKLKLIDKWSLVHIRREKNIRADELSKLGMDKAKSEK